MGRIDYDRAEESASALDREASSEPPIGSPTMLLQTFAEATYPTLPARVHACRPVTATASPTEGSAATLTTGGGTVYAANLGSGVPPVGTYVLAVRDGGAWIFRYDG